MVVIVAKEKNHYHRLWNSSTIQPHHTNLEKGIMKLGMSTRLVNLGES